MVSFISIILSIPDLLLSAIFAVVTSVVGLVGQLLDLFLFVGQCFVDVLDGSISIAVVGVILYFLSARLHSRLVKEVARLRFAGDVILAEAWKTFAKLTKYTLPFAVRALMRTLQLTQFANLSTIQDKCNMLSLLMQSLLQNNANMLTLHEIRQAYQRRALNIGNYSKVHGYHIVPCADGNIFIDADTNLLVKKKLPSAIDNEIYILIEEKGRLVDVTPSNDTFPTFPRGTVYHVYRRERFVSNRLGLTWNPKTWLRVFIPTEPTLLGKHKSIDDLAEKWLSF